MSKILSFLLVVAFVVNSVSCLASDGQLFSEKCGACHYRGGPSNPIFIGQKAGATWQRFFRNKRHKVDFSAEISEDDLREILVFMADNAADSHQPLINRIP